LDTLKKDGNNKLTIVFTDGYIDDGFGDKDYNYSVVLFVSSSGGDRTVDELRKRFKKVIHQDGIN
jgi:predicted metal-dependent peptidase